ncbi:MAG TPA: alpha/beta hydrolase-fold protein [Cyclobacteriaceae bacterium]|nr:alpha/beta hydrolase-fold protein [Cyclobacteriaceae bacterium]
MQRLLSLGLILISTMLFAQDYSNYSTTLAKLHSLSTIGDESERTKQTDQLWQSLMKSNSIPLVQEDSVAFLYRGKANTVSWVGDFNGWGYDKKFNGKGIKVQNTDIWLLKTTFPKNARFDYKLIVNGTDWMIDFFNPYQQWSGVGGGSPNSELRMPNWKQEQVSIAREGIQKGKVVNDILMNSASLGYQITYSVYLPVGYSDAKKYPVIYVTDGYEYLHERMGNMATVLDNLIADKKIQPVVAIFIDHREPVNRSNNRRMQELAMNPAYLTFFENEFIPHIELMYSVMKDPKQRAILGTSMGGLTSAYFAFTKPGVFGMAGIQSPAFKFKPEIYTVCDKPENPPVKVYLTTGIYFDAAVESRKMKEILEKNFCTYQYSETNQGHSWGNFRDTIDDILVYFFPTK